MNGRYFCTTASMGLSVKITEELSPKVIRRSRPFRAEISWEGGTLQSRTVQIVVGNGRYYGAALAVAPGATIDDARLDLYSLEVNHWWELVRLTPSLKGGTHVHRGEVEALRAMTIEIRTRRAMPIDLDEEIGAETPATFKVVPRALEVFVPGPWTQ